MIRKLIISVAKTVLSAVYFSFRKVDGVYISFPMYQHVFFGYYDIRPFSPNGENLALHAQKPQSTSVDIIYCGIDGNSFKKIGETQAWNYQQGARLMWLNENEIIFNIYDKKRRKYLAQIVNLLESTSRVLPFSVQAVHKQSYILSLNYFHLFQVGTEYGYPHPDNTNRYDIIRYDFLKDVHEILFSIEDCRLRLKNKYESFEREFVNHLMISSDGEKFILLYRFHQGNRRIDNLFLYKFADRELKLLIEDEVLSHCTWRNDFEFLFWGQVKSVAGYYLFDIRTNDFKLIYKTKFDGHPSFINDHEFLTDTYPDRLLRQKLYRHNIQIKSNEVICEHRHPGIYEHSDRCDLHPSLSASHKLFQIDVLDKGRRKVLIGNL